MTTNLFQYQFENIPDEELTVMLFILLGEIGMVKNTGVSYPNLMLDFKEKQFNFFKKEHYKRFGKENTINILHDALNSDYFKTLSREAKNFLEDFDIE